MLYINAKMMKGDDMLKNNIKRHSLDEIQIARAFAIIAVLAVHSSSTGVTSVPHDSMLFPIYNFFNIAGKLGTPTFIFLSSFILFYNYYPRETSWSFMKNFYIKRIKFILIPYLLFSAIYFAIKWYAYYDYPSLAAAALRFLELVSMGKAHPHLYFVFISVQFYLLFPLLLILFKKVSFVRKHAIWLGILLQWIWVILNKYYFGITIKGSISLSYLSFYFMGAYLGIYYNDIREKMRHTAYRVKRLVPIFIGYVTMVILYTGYMYLARTGAWQTISTKLPQLVNSYIAEFTWAFHALFAALVIFYCAHVANKRFSPRLKTLFMEIGATSFGIYLIHPLFLLVARAIYSSGPPLLFHGWQIFTFFAISILSWAIVRLVYYYVPYEWVIFGKMDPMKKYDQLPSSKVLLRKNA